MLSEGGSISTAPTHRHPDHEGHRDASFVEYAHVWLGQRAISRRTHDNYRRLLTAHLLPTFTDMPLPDITAAAVTDWYATLAAASTTQTHAYVLLRSIMRSALAGNLIESDPCQIDGITTSRRAAQAPSADAEEVEAIAAAIVPQAYGAVVLMSAWLTMPFSELRELRRHDVDLDAGIVRVRRAVALIRGRYEVTTPKSTEGIRDIVIPARPRPAIRAHLRDHVAPHSAALLFPAVGDPDRYLNPSVLDAMYRRARDKAGRPDLRVADLQRSQPQLTAASATTG